MSMDKIDEHMMKELDSDPQIPLSALAKKLRISQQVAAYRLKRLFEQGSIAKLGTIVNLKALRQEGYSVFFTFNAKKGLSCSEVFEWLRNRSNVLWAARIGGRYDLYVELFVFDFEQFEQFIDDFNRRFPGLIKDYKNCYLLEHYIYRHKYLSGNYDIISYGYKDKTVDIDELDRYILDKIWENCRLSALEISQGKGVTYKTVINRIKAMEKKRVIVGYRMFIKSKEFRPFAVVLSLKNYSKQAEKNLLAYLSRHDNVTFVNRLFGIWNMLVYVRARDDEQLKSIAIDLRDRFDIIDNYEIIPIFEDIAINLMPV